MDNSTFALLAVAVITIGTYLLLPNGYRYYAILVPLLILFVAAVVTLFRIWGFSFNLLALVALGLAIIVARVVVGKRM